MTGMARSSRLGHRLGLNRDGAFYVSIGWNFALRSAWPTGLIAPVTGPSRECSHGPLAVCQRIPEENVRSLVLW
jgi:hypothetical protein